MCDWKKELSSTRELMDSYSMEEDIRIPAWLDRMATEENSTSLDSQATYLVSRCFICLYVEKIYKRVVETY